MTKGLTVKGIERLIRKGTPAKVTDGGADGVKGLMVCVEGQGSAAWLLRYQRDHRTRHMGLGSVRDVTLREARDKARRARAQLADGVDPLALKQSERTATAAAAAKRLTFKQAAERYHAANEAGWSSARTGFEFLSSLERHAYRHIGGLDVGAIGKDEVLRVLEAPLKGGGPFWTVKAITADRVRNRIERVLSWAVARGVRAEGTNPASWGVLSHLLPAPRKVAPVVHMRSLPYQQVPELMAKLQAEETVAAMAARLVVLTATRASEALGATWPEVDLTAAEWVIPAERMKGRQGERREHRVPLSPQVVELLEALPREASNTFLFISAKAAGKALTAPLVTGALRRAGCATDLHGFRSSFRDWAAERTNSPREVCEAALAHRVGNQVELAYKRSDLFEKRRKLMAQWALFVCSPPKGAVLPLRRPASK
jgi:integrase